MKSCRRCVLPDRAIRLLFYPSLPGSLVPFPIIFQHFAQRRSQPGVVVVEVVDLRASRSHWPTNDFSPPPPVKLKYSKKLLQGAAYGRGLSFVDTFVKCSTGWWAVTVAALQPSWYVEVW